MLSKLLVPVDGSENSLRALDHAIYLAKKTGANITAMNVIENPPTVYVESQKLLNDLLANFRVMQHPPWLGMLRRETLIL
jgi:nucleotide-binding universal stress UspA family protein